MSEVKRYCAEKSDLEICWEGSKPEPDDLVMYADFDRVTAERDALRVALEQSGDLKNDLQDLLTAADERADVLEGLLREVVALDPRGEFLGWQLDGKIDAALKPAEGVGDDATLEEDREDFKKVFVRINTKQGQSISLADMIARYEKKP